MTVIRPDNPDPDADRRIRLPEIVLDLSPHEVMRALEALRGEPRGFIAGIVAQKLEEAAPEHLVVLREEWP